MREQGETPVLDDSFVLAKEIGRGATGTVWEATDVATGQVVAIKVLHPHLFASALARKRFYREMKSASLLRHQNAVAVISRAGLAQGTAYLVMERLWGMTLAEALRQGGALPQLRAVKIIAQVLDALAAAHSQGLIHRDLKPSNVMLIDRDGDSDFVKVCDFGLAKLLDRGVSDRPSDGDFASDLWSITTETGGICGTPEYMAPEQARGEPVDARSDLYSIAVMLYQAVVGQVPFSGRSALAVVSLQASASPPRPSVVSPERDIFPPLENLILRALAKDPAERPSSAEVFRSDLLQIALDYRRRQRPRGAGDGACSRGPAATLPASGAHSGRPSRLGRAAIIAAALGLTFAASLARRWPSESARATQLPSAGPNRAAAGPEISRAPTLPQPGAIATGVPSAATATDDFQRRVGRLKVPGRALRPTLAKSVVTGRGAAEAEQRATLARAILLVRRAEEVLGQGRVGEACAVGLRGAADAPGAAVVWEFLGRCYMRLGQPDEARLYYQKYLAVAPPGTNTTIVRAIVGDDPTSGAR